VSGLNRMLGSGANQASLADTAQWPNSCERSSCYVMTVSHRWMPLVAGQRADASTDSVLDVNPADAYGKRNRRRRYELPRMYGP